MRKIKEELNKHSHVTVAIHSDQMHYEYYKVKKDGVWICLITNTALERMLALRLATEIWIEKSVKQDYDQDTVESSLKAFVDYWSVIDEADDAFYGQETIHEHILEFDDEPLPEVIRQYFGDSYDLGDKRG